MCDQYYQPWVRMGRYCQRWSSLSAGKVHKEQLQQRKKNNIKKPNPARANRHIYTNTPILKNYIKKNKNIFISFRETN